VESAVADTLVTVTARDRAATRRVLEWLARHLESPVAGGRAPKSSRKEPRERRLTTCLTWAAGPPGAHSLRGRS
jgi:hypothetical protein